MNVLQVNQGDTLGGAGIAGYRLHEGLLAAGVDSYVLGGVKQTTSSRVERAPGGLWLDRWKQDVARKIGLNYLFVKRRPLIEHPFVKAADVINFHNLHGGYFNYRALPEMTRDKPGVLTLHDVYAMTGHCSYNLECQRFTPAVRCGRCPHMGVYPDIRIDNTRLEWKLKDKAYARSNLTVVAPTAWMADNARRGMLGRFKVHHIPNGLDTSVYRPLEKPWCRRVLDLPGPETGKTVLMFAADGLMQPRKGGDLLLAALARLPATLRRRLVLLTLGIGAEALAEQSGMQTRPLAYVGDDRLKAIAFSAADVFVLPTRWDNLPIVVQESLACGTPAVSFRVGGLPEMIQPERTGLLADPEDPASLAAAIERLAEDAAAREAMAPHCRAFAVAEYDIALMVRRYMNLYEELLGKRSASADAAPLTAAPGQRAARPLLETQPS